jgi:2-desacetyl-2-hydroxyethyl bacteriochlorophyllide A dehydrogenase
MPIRTQAVVIVEPWRVELQPVTIPDPEPHEVLARTLVSGISVGTERHYITGAYADMGKDVAANFPFATGYQRSAVIERVGSAVEGLKVGDRVLMGRSRIKEPHIKGSGGHVGYGVVDAKQAYKMPVEADDEEAALWVMAGVGLHGARMSRVDKGEVVALLGLGMIGQMAAQAARFRGARVIASDRCQHRVDLAAAHSADVAVTADAETFAKRIRADYPNGVDVVTDTGSKTAVWDACVRMARREGRINLQGYYPGSFTIDSYAAHVNRVTAVCPSGYDDPNDIAQHLAGKQRFAISPLITHRFSAREAEAAYDLVKRAPQEIVGGILDWRDL